MRQFFVKRPKFLASTSRLRVEYNLGTYHLFCAGEVNFEGGNRKKADLIKGRIKFGRNVVRGERNYEFVQGGNTFFDNLNV